MLRSYLKSFAPLGALIGALSTVSPVYATDTTFAAFTAGNATFSAVHSAGTVTLSESQPVTFSFMNTNYDSIVNGIAATLSFSATALNSNYSTAAGFGTQSGISGAYIFKSTKAYQLGSKIFAAGSNLLTVTFSGAQLSGKLSGKTAGFGGDSTLAGSINYTSDFLNFGNTNTEDFSIVLSAINPSFSGSTFLNGFTGTPVGSFASDPGPASNAPVPEPATWVLMLVGFGTIGLSRRGNPRRKLRSA